MNYFNLHRHQPIAHHKRTPAPKVNPNLPLPQIPIPVRLTISNANSLTNLGDFSFGLASHQ
ncbi:hypothetical protein [uncultured Nostoc sp.]|uniref:hypothetical protein n=1 Tax=uncultured Nostoc sp. TaxID=340711 RepID=UPI0035CB080B